MDHRATPDDRVVLAGEKVHAHQFHAELLGRDDLFVLVGLWWFVGVDHPRDVRAVDVRVEQSNACAHVRDAGRKVHRDRRFADAALAGGDGDDVLDVRQDGVLGVEPTVDTRREVDIVFGAGQCIADITGECGLGRRVWGTKREVDADRLTLLVDIDAVDQTERDDVVTEVGVGDGPQ